MDERAYKRMQVKSQASRLGFFPGGDYNNCRFSRYKIVVLSHTGHELYSDDGVLGIEQIEHLSNRC